MQWLQTYKPSRLSSGGVGRVRPETFPLLAQFRGCAVPLDPPAEAGVNWAARRACAGIFTGPVLRDVHARTLLLTCGVLVGGSRYETRRRPGWCRPYPARRGRTRRRLATVPPGNQVKQSSTASQSKSVRLCVVEYAGPQHTMSNLMTDLSSIVRAGVMMRGMGVPDAEHHWEPTVRAMPGYRMTGEVPARSARRRVDAAGPARRFAGPGGSLGLHSGDVHASSRRLRPGWGPNSSNPTWCPPGVMSCSPGARRRSGGPRTWPAARSSSAAEPQRSSMGARSVETRRPSLRRGCRPLTGRRATSPALRLRSLAAARSSTTIDAQANRASRSA